MKNKEKFANEIADIAITNVCLFGVNPQGEVKSCSLLDCCSCKFVGNNTSACRKNRKEWAESEYKEPITIERLAEVFNQEYPNYDIMVAKVAFRWLLNRYTLTEKEAEK